MMTTHLRLMLDTMMVLVLAMVAMQVKLLTVALMASVVMAKAVMLARKLETALLWHLPCQAALASPLRLSPAPKMCLQHGLRIMLLNLVTTTVQ